MWHESVTAAAVEESKRKVEAPLKMRQLTGRAAPRPPSAQHLVSAQPGWFPAPPPWESSGQSWWWIFCWCYSTALSLCLAAEHGHTFIQFLSKLLKPNVCSSSPLQISALHKYIYKLIMLSPLFVFSWCQLFLSPCWSLKENNTNWGWVRLLYFSLSLYTHKERLVG